MRPQRASESVPISGSEDNIQHQEQQAHSSNDGPLIGKMGLEVFKYDCLDRQLDRRHITGK